MTKSKKAIKGYKSKTRFYWTLSRQLQLGLKNSRLLNSNVRIQRHINVLRFKTFGNKFTTV